MIGRSPKSKSIADIAREWDLLAHDRSLQLRNHEDLSMDYLLLPIIEKLSHGLDKSNVIDLGCGTGYLTKEIANKSKAVVGIDISLKSIEEARECCKSLNNVEFKNYSIEQFAEGNKLSYSLAIANMTLMDVPDLEAVVEAVSKMLRRDSHFIFTITHPYFWPLYWKYAFEDWFNYGKEIEIENEFYISLSRTGFKTTHYHRPLQAYLNIITDNGFEIEEVNEPMPSPDVEKMYPEKWAFPRFFALKCSKK